MKDIAKIKEQLPYGAQSEIARKMNVSVVLVNRVLNGGKHNRPDVLNAIADYLSDYKKLKNEAESRLNSLLD